MKDYENCEMISLQEVWQAAGGHPEIKATKEEVILVLNLLDQCVDEQDEDIQKLDKELDSIKDMLSRLVKENDNAMPNEKHQWMFSPMRAECLKLMKGDQ